MLEQNRKKMKQLIEDKHHHKADDNHGKPDKKMGAVHRRYSNMKHGAPMNKVK